MPYAAPYAAPYGAMYGAGYGAPVGMNAYQAPTVWQATISEKSSVYIATIFSYVLGH
jgi:hypothetical protein